MKNLLVIAYYFPPSGGPGVQRVLKHVKYLTEFGWNPIVLTVSNGQFPARDESLLAQIPKNIIVERTQIYEPYDIYRFLTGKKPGSAIDVNTIKKDGTEIGFKEKLAEFIRATFFIPDARIGWMLSARKAALELIKKHDIQAVYSSSPPYTCSLIARYVKRKTGLPWVAGFRDPWTGFISSPKRWAFPAYIDRSMEKSTFMEADAVECAWQGIIKDAMSKYPDLNQNKFHHVPNGFDSADFPKVSKNEDEVFTLTYTGSLYGRRNPSSLFEAIEKLIKEGKITKNDFKIRFVGRFGNEVEDMFEKASFSTSIEKIGYVPHGKSIEYLMLSDALLLIVDESKESEAIVPGKVYEYVGVGRPIIAIAPPQSAIAALMKETNAGDVAHQTEIDKTAEIFLKLIEGKKKGKMYYNPNNDIIKSYERRSSAEKLSQLLNQFSV